MRPGLKILEPHIAGPMQRWSLGSLSDHNLLNARRALRYRLCGATNTFDLGSTNGQEEQDLGHCTARPWHRVSTFSYDQEIDCTDSFKERASPLSSGLLRCTN